MSVNPLTALMLHPQGKLEQEIVIPEVFQWGLGSFTNSVK